MATLDEDSPFGIPPRRPVAEHEIGQPLEQLSLDEISERIETLRSEITRLEQVRVRKESTRRIADSFFKL